MENQLFNIWSNHTNNLGVESIEEIYSKIKNGTYKKVIELIRRSNNSELKNQLDGITFSSNCGDKSRRTENIVEYTSFIILDFDKLTNIEETKSKIVQSEYTVMCFVSPSGNGLKVLVKTDNYDLLYHKSAYKQVQKYYEDLTNEKLDENTKDAVRLCYFSYDKTAYLNLSAKEYIIEENEIEETKNENYLNKDFEDKIIKTVIFTNNRAKFKKGNRNKYLFFLATNCCKMGYNKGQVIQYCCSEFSQTDFCNDEITKTINSAYQINKHSFGINDKYNRSNSSNSNDLINQIEKLNNTVKILSDFILKSANKEEI